MNVLEDEYHFTLVCPLYRDLRCKLLPSYYCRWPSKQRFVKLFRSSSAVLLNKLADFFFFFFSLAMDLQSTTNTNQDLAFV